MGNLNQFFVTVVVLFLIVMLINRLDSFLKRNKRKAQEEILTYLSVTNPEDVLELTYYKSDDTSRGGLLLSSIYTLNYNSKSYRIYIHDSFLQPNKSLAPCIPQTLNITVCDLKEYLDLKISNGKIFIWLD